MQSLMDVSVHNANWISHYFSEVSEQLKADKPNAGAIFLNIREIVSTNDNDDFTDEMKSLLNRMNKKLGFDQVFKLATLSCHSLDQESPMHITIQTWLEENKPQ